MTVELTTLLPEERQPRAQTEYYVRLATVALCTLTGIIVLGIVLLTPSFLYLHNEIQARQVRINGLDQNLATPNGQSANTELASLSASAMYLTRLASTTTTSAALRAVLAIP